MKSIIKFCICIILCFGLVSIVACSDDKIKDEPTPVLPDKPEDKPDDSEPSTKILGVWTVDETNYGDISNISSTNRVEFASDSVTINWYDKKDNKFPYSIVKGKYTIKGDSLKFEWHSVMVDSIAGTAFNTVYLSGVYKIRDNKYMTYNYSIYDISGEKLSGSHSMQLTKTN